jgi:protein-arginine kinase activator protein McsA
MSSERCREINLCEDCRKKKAKFLYKYISFFRNIELMLCEICIHKSEYHQIK